MMNPEDWFYGGIPGIALVALGLLPILNTYKIVNVAWFGLIGKYLSASIVMWLIAVSALFLVYQSTQEIMNSNSMGWISISIGLALLAIGGLQILTSFGVNIGFKLPVFPVMIYQVFMVVEGIFLFLSMFFKHL